jgi:putative ABC transport system permease protein
MAHRTPLAWLNLKHDFRRLAAAVAGVCFAVLLMFMETGFMYALFDSTVKLVDDARADLVLVSPARYVLAAEKRFPLARLNQVRSVPGVEAAYAVYIERSLATLRPLPRGVPQPVRVIGTSAAEEAFQFDDRPEDAPPLAVLDRPQSALIDDKSKRAQFGFALDAVADDQPVRAELSGSRIDIIGSFSLGTDFASDGTLLLSAANLANYFPWRNAGGEPLGAVDLGFVKLAPDADGEATVARIRDVMADEVTVLTKAAYRQREVDFWKANTPVGMIFQIGTWMGFVVGVIICYQVLYTDIADHLKEYATLKAMGYRPGYFVRLVLAESVILSVMGFIPGVVLSWILYTWLGVSTGLLMNLTVSRAGIVLALTIAMCIVSGVFALKKLLRADPAALF